MTQTEQIPDHPVYSRNVLEFLTVAHDFCQTLNKVERLEKHQLVDYLTKVAPLLYLKGALLPDVEVSDPGRNERFFTEEEWEFLFNSLRKVFGKYDQFWYADTNQSDELIKASVSEFLTDVFQDLQDFMTLYQKSSLAAKENAVAELKKYFITNWGVKVLRIQGPLHTAFFNNKIPPPEFNIPELI